MLGLSQTDLARACEISFQQIQKYEVAENRISASRLTQIGEALRIPVSYFFDGLPNQTPYGGLRDGKSKVAQPDPDDPLSRADVAQLVSLFVKLSTNEARAGVLQFIRLILSGGNKD